MWGGVLHRVLKSLVCMLLTHFLHRLARAATSAGPNCIACLAAARIGVEANRPTNQQKDSPNVARVPKTPRAPAATRRRLGGGRSARPVFIYGSHGSTGWTARPPTYTADI